MYHFNIKMYIANWSYVTILYVNCWQMYKLTPTLVNVYLRIEKMVLKQSLIYA